MKNRFLLHDLCMMHKIKMRWLPPYLCDCFETCLNVHEHLTRQQQDFYLSNYRTTLREKTFFIIIVREYNNLPSNIKSKTTINSFKSAIKSQLLSNQ